jgi:hypothetical protein
MDAGLPRILFLGIALFQCMIILTTFKVASSIRPKTA